MSDRPLAPTSHIEGLDVIRALAAMAVLACHAVQASTTWSPSWSAGPWSAWGPTITTTMEEAGAWGVGIFFVLSGLCIHLPLARKLAAGTSSAQVDVKDYFRRRFRRIYPPHLVVLALSATVALILPLGAYGIHPMISAPTGKQLALHLVMLHAFFPSAIYSINNVLWTIAVEAQFYLLYPLLLLARRKLPMRTLCVALFGVAIFIHGGAKVLGLDEVTKSVLAHSFVCRFWEWVLGCWAAEILVSERRPKTFPRAALFLGLGASWAVASLVRAEVPLGTLLNALGMPWIFALLVIAGCGISARGEGALVRVGRASYSLYLVHPIALSVVLLALRARGLSSVWLELTLGVAASFLAMQVFFKGIESRFLAKRPTAKLVSASAG